MLHHLAGDADAALATMRQLLKDDPDGQKAQAARNVVVLYAVEKICSPKQTPQSKHTFVISHKPQTIVIAWSC